MIEFKIKICGVTNRADALKAVEYGADAIGLNFYARSLRSVTIDQAVEIAQALRETSTKIVGVFVNHNPEKILEFVRVVNLDIIQLHGDETPDAIQQLNDRPVIRAIRCGDLDQQRIISQVQTWTSAGAQAVLVDSSPGKPKPDEYGGTGETLSWEKIANIERKQPLILAGGLDPTNVATAIETVRPDAVDTASGVESFPGKKDDDLLKRFIENARSAFQKPGNSWKTP